MAEHDTPPPTITAMKIPVIKKGEYDIWSMRMRQYTNHNLWDVIVNGDLEEDHAPTTGETSAPPAPKTAKQLAARRNQERVKSILLLAIPDEYLLESEGVKKEDLYGDNGKEQATNKMNLSSQALFNYALMAISSFKLISSSDMSCVLSPKLNKDRVIIEDWNSDDEEEVSEVQKVRPENQTVKTRDDKSGQNSQNKELVLGK
ncbi:hypothetical protein Tco_0241635 [Tanacetum coccineum]